MFIHKLILNVFKNLQFFEISNKLLSVIFLLSPKLRTVNSKQFLTIAIIPMSVIFEQPYKLRTFICIQLFEISNKLKSVILLHRKYQSYTILIYFVIAIAIAIKPTSVILKQLERSITFKLEKCLQFQLNLIF
jgi:hypothetical protein